MRTRIILVLIFILLHEAVLAQKENNVWVFGHSAGLDFNVGVPTPINKQIGSNEGCASVANAKGELLFYCVGGQIWNRNGQVMPNGSNIVTYPTIRSSQGSLIVPVINNGLRYYVFSLEEAESASGVACRLSYSIVNMGLNGGLGDVEPGSKGILLDQQLTEKMIAIPGDDCNVWVLTHKKGSNEFRAHEVTESGIVSSTVLSNAGNLTGPNAYLSGVMKISPDRRTLAVCSAGDLTAASPNVTGIELMDFNPATGAVSNARTLEDQDLCYGACFSPDGSKLYTGGDRYPTGGQFLCQFDLTQTTINDIINSKSDLYLHPNPGFIKLTDMRAGPDDKIYLNSSTNLDYLDVLNSPNLPATGSGYQSNAIHLISGTTGHYGLPNTYVVPVPGDTIYSRTEVVICNPPDSLILRASSDDFFFEWDNGSTDSLRTVKKPGIYWVRSKTYCQVRIDTFQVKETVDLRFSLGSDSEVCIKPYTITAPFIPGASYMWSTGSTSSSIEVSQSGAYEVNVSKHGCTHSDEVAITITDLQQHLDDVISCYGSPVDVQLSANVPADGFAIWSTGSNSSSIQVTDTGNYWVEVTKGVCKASDTVSVSQAFCDCKFGFPTVFSPNADGRNDIFRIIVQQGCPVRGYVLTIFNRWGEKVYVTNNEQDGWNGTYRGIPAETGVYMYHVQFAAGDKWVRHDMTGDITLIR